MTTPCRMTINRRLERAGYVPVRSGDAAGWVPAAVARRVRREIEQHRETVEQIASEPPMPRGRPRKAGE